MKKALKLLAAGFVSIGILAACDGEVPEDQDPAVNDPGIEDPAVDDPVDEDPGVDGVDEGF